MNQSEELPVEDVWVALDLETTGLNPKVDAIIEVGAVKFCGSELIDIFQSHVNPNRELSSFIKGLTGITQDQVDNAPQFSEVSQGLGEFLHQIPIVGHNVAFDIGFLESNGMMISNPRADTFDLAYVLMPGATGYSLANIASSLGVSHPNAHSALSDASATQKIFIKLTAMISELDVYTLAEMGRLASRSPWILSDYLNKLKAGAIGKRNALARDSNILGAEDKVFNYSDLRGRVHPRRSLVANDSESKVDAKEISYLLRKGGPLDSVLANFEERSEQIEMACGVAESISEGKRLVVEAGTGVGKSLAYLLPAALYAMRNNKRVVVSTNTINLQEQLLRKDIPSLVNTLKEVEGIEADDFRYAQLKGRANYLCLNRWVSLRESEALSSDEARLLSKSLVWLRTSESGDRSELNLGHRRAAAPWDRISAQGARECSGVSGVCFLRAARERAAAAHLVVVNHALLMSDLVTGGTLIPDYDILIIDEGHHLEEEATRHLGFEVSQLGFDELLSTFIGETGLLNRLEVAFRISALSDSRRETFGEIIANVFTLISKTRGVITGVFAVLDNLVSENESYIDNQALRVTRATRNQPDWSTLEIEWETADLTLSTLYNGLLELNLSIKSLEESEVQGCDALLGELLKSQQLVADLRARLGEFVAHPNDESIYWISRFGTGSNLTLHSAPLHIAPDLNQLLFKNKHSVILTSATLTTNGTFDHVLERTGFEDAEQLLLGSPFDYSKAVSLIVPRDMPDPYGDSYSEAIASAVTDSTVAAKGRTMALFTSHVSLQEVSSAIRGNLWTMGYEVFAQGVDGTPHQLIRKFQANPESVLLGTASFWEGVDLPGAALKVLLLARLPFNVPTEPIFQSRSELYDNPFVQYALPQAVLRMRQGFGRLIRTGTDRGTFIILDRRIVARSYGASFIKSLPDGVPLTQPRLRDLKTEITDCLAKT